MCIGKLCIKCIKCDNNIMYSEYYSLLAVPPALPESKISFVL